MALYSEKVMDHFTNPRNVGVIENASGVGEVGNAKCGDIMKIYLQIENEIIVDVKSTVRSPVKPTMCRKVIRMPTIPLWQCVSPTVIPVFGPVVTCMFPAKSV